MFSDSASRVERVKGREGKLLLHWSMQKIAVEGFFSCLSLMLESRHDALHKRRAGVRPDPDPFEIAIALSDPDPC